MKINFLWVRLISSVCNNCEAARLSMAESASWQPLLVIVGLLGCAVPSVLKAELIKTLASLSKTPDVALVVWQNIESAQIISTLPLARYKNITYRVSVKKTDNCQSLFS